jgi:hypothetical protein
MGTDSDENAAKRFPNIDAVVEYDDRANLARKFSEASDQIAAQRGRQA